MSYAPPTTVMSSKSYNTKQKQTGAQWATGASWWTLPTTATPRPATTPAGDQALGG
jgi:hypothetical protein